MDVSIITSVDNQKDNIFKFCEILIHSLKNLSLSYEILLWDNCSKDGSYRVIEEVASRYPGVKGFSNPRRLGFGVTLRELLSESKGEDIVYVDMSSRAEVGALPLLLESIKSNHIVLASRLADANSRKFAKISLFLRIYFFICKIVLNISVEDIVPKIVVLRKENVAALDLKADGFDIFPEIFAKATRKHLVIHEIPVDSSSSNNDFSKEKANLASLINIFKI